MEADPLLQLIKSLSRSEKMFFKKQASGFVQGRQPAYLLLFDELNRASVKAEAELREQFSAGRSAAYFPTLKQYLYDKILDSLRHYEKDKDPQYLAENKKREAELLIERKLYDQGLKRLREARQLAYQLQHYTLLTDALRLENNTLGLFKLHEGIERKKQINAEIKELLFLLEQERFYFACYDHLYTYSRQEPALRDREELEKIRLQREHPDLQHKEAPKSLRSKHLFYGFHTTYHSLTGNYEKAYEYSLEMLNIWEDYPLLRQVRFKEYLALFVNHANRCYQLKKIGEFRQRIDEMKKMRSPSRVLQQLIDDRLALFALSYHELSGDFRDFQSTRQLADRALERHHLSGNLAEQRLILYNLSYQLFLQGQYGQALDYSIAFEQAGAGPDTQVYLRRSNKLLNMLIHFESGNFQYLDNIWRNSYLQLERSGQLFAFEALFIRMIREFTEAAQLYGSKLNYCHYIREFSALKADPFEKKTFEYLDIISWLEARRRGCGMLEVLYG